MTETKLIGWTHLKSITQELKEAGVIHAPAFPSLDGSLCYYPFPTGYKQLQLAHRLHGETDIILKQVDESMELVRISTTFFPLTSWETGTLESWIFEVNASQIKLFEEQLKESIGEAIFQTMSDFIKKEQNYGKDLSLVLDFYHDEIKKLEASLPPFLSNRYKVDCTLAPQKSIPADLQAALLLYLFGNYTYHLHQDLQALGYLLLTLDFEAGSLSFKLEEQREQITIQWAKDYTNAILMTKQESGYHKALLGAQCFSKFCKEHPYIGLLPSLGGQLNDLADTLTASCKMGLIKEGITQKDWDSKRVVKEWDQMIGQLPLTIKDSILIGSPMETLYSFTVNTVAWIEAKGDYNEAKAIMLSYLNYYEIRLQHSEKKNKELSTALAASFYSYLSKDNHIDSDAFPVLSKHAKSIRTPYRQLAQVYKPKQRITDGMKGFFHYISRGNGNRVMGTSIGLSLLLMIVIYIVL